MEHCEGDYIYYYVGFSIIFMGECIYCFDYSIFIGIREAFYIDLSLLILFAYTFLEL